MTLFELKMITNMLDQDNAPEGIIIAIHWIKKFFEQRQKSYLCRGKTAPGGVLLPGEPGLQKTI
ncbi:hypothetical protein KDA_29400 [Dictyobacter alpinus]|uniref:Uncharacterized protein n=1 Tax=Dictyobacter alpinus TaxID=2014873 RepID=A0A402B7Z0_9CHLR|nr:hypothetical protein [Dictyobacter alpinus]GCE27456.1 hypothetical protein KDA_29400 [Dictyobacter alpinus]